MELNYEENELIMQKFIADCRNEIQNKFFSEDKIKDDEIKKQRNEMIDIKLNHTMRVVEDVAKMSQKMNLSIDFTKVVKISALLHDYARFKQAIWTDNFIDKNCLEFNGANHAEYGYQLLYVNNRLKDFKIPQNYQFGISQVVRYHQVGVLEGDLALHFTSKDQLNPNLLKGYETLNGSEKIIVATLVQMVKDVDMLDILYQHLTGEFPVHKPLINYDINGDSLSDISKHFGISEEEIMEFNDLKSNDLGEMKSIKIPVANVEPIRLSVPIDIQQRFFNNENIELKELMNRQDWTFITGMWWRLNHFLNNINFTSNLELVKEKNLLDQIYATYPDKYKPLVKDAFEFAQEQLVDKRIIENNGIIFMSENTKHVR